MKNRYLIIRGFFNKYYNISIQMLKLKLVIVGTIAAFVSANPINKGIVEFVKQQTTLWTPAEVNENPFANYTQA